MRYLPLAARICLALIFIKAGVSHMQGYSGFVNYLGTTLPIPHLLAIGTIVFQLLGALSLVLGYRIKIGASLLIIFLIPASILFHNFIADPEQLNSFLKNVGLIGGLLMVIYTGAGPISLDSKAQAG